MNPKIRFKKEDGSSFDDYSMVKIGTLASKIQSGGTPKSSCKEYYDGDIKFLSISDMTKAGKYVKTTEKFLTEAGINNSSAWVVPKRSVLLSMYASYGKACINEEEVATSQAILAIIPANNNAEYLYQLLTHLQQDKFWDAYIKSGTQPNLSKSVIENTVVSVPILEEQQKIAAFFTALDEKITLAEKQLAFTERISKGVLEKIYKGELRFKQSNGSSFPDWQVRTLDQLLKFQNGINASKEQFGTGIKLISVKEVLSDVPVTYDSIASSVEVDDKEAKRFSVEYGDIVFQRSSETAEEAGSANVYLDSRPAVFGGFVIRGKMIADYHPQFMKMALRSKQVRRQIVRLAQGAQHVNIGQEQLSSVVVQFPCLAEQEKIAELISNFDHKKATLLARLNKLKRLKQAFMQQMFV